jgi:hypothetical protein
MILDVAKERWNLKRESTLLQDLIADEENYPQWMEHCCSSILHHERECCEKARLWFLAYARSMEGWASSQYELRPPTWLSRMFTWGPSVWPISWCELVKEKVIDCGVFAALAREIFRAQGFQPHPAQVLLYYNESCTDHWKALWERGMKNVDEKKLGDVFPWVGNQIVYHELCLLEMPDGTAKIYDSSWGHWFEPQPRIGYGGILAVRSECPRLLEWGDHVLSYGEWVNL